MTKLGEYVEEIRRRHPRLSMRAMALEAGLSQNTVSKIIKEERGARPETLKAIADTWGDERDFEQMMQLAGHPVPVYSTAVQALQNDEHQMLEIYRNLTPERRERFRELLAHAPDFIPEEVLVRFEALAMTPAGIDEDRLREIGWIFIYYLSELLQLDAQEQAIYFRTVAERLSRRLGEDVGRET